MLSNVIGCSEEVGESDFLLLLRMQTIRTLIPKSADIFVNSYDLNPIFFVMAAFLGGYENRFLSATTALLLHH